MIIGTSELLGRSNEIINLVVFLRHELHTVSLLPNQQHVNWPVA
jgi:hypothetical protein